MVQKEIFARFPRPALVGIGLGERSGRWEGFLDGVLARLVVGGGERGVVVGSVEGGMVGGERAGGTRAVGGEKVRMGVSGEMVDTKDELRERSHEMTGDEALDGRDVGAVGEEEKMAAGDEHALHESAVDMIGGVHGNADLKHASSAAMEKRWTGDEDEHVRNKEHQTAKKVQKNWKTSTEISVRVDTAIEKRRVDMDMENGGLEVRGQMGGLKG